jgi:hypothetical protein
MSLRSAALSAGVLLLSLVSMGCGSSGTVSGKVTYQGEDLGGGTVLFVSPGKKTERATIAPDGSYTIANIPTGTVKIAVETASARPPDPETMRRGMPQIPPDANLPPEAEKSMYKSSPENKGGKYIRIPDEYGDPDKSKLTLEVTGGNQHHDIELR